MRIDPIKILQRAWHIVWNYRALWVFGLIIALAVGSGPSGNGDNNRVQNRVQAPSYGSVQEALDAFRSSVNKLFQEGIPQMNIPGEAIPSFLWTIGGFVVFMLLVGLVVTIAYYVSVTAVIRMVDEYESSGTKLSVREGFRLGWSRTAWRVFLINLLVHLPLILFLLALLTAGTAIFLRFWNGMLTFTPLVIVSMIVLLFLGLFGMLLITFVLLLLRPFFWRVCVLEGAGVRASLRQGLAMVRENWMSVGVMWLVMIGLGIIWLAVSILAILLTLPLIVVTAVLAAMVVAIPGLLLVGLFSLFLTGPLPWIAAGLFILPLFFTIAFSPWLVLGSWQQIYTSSVWTLTYRELKALPSLLPPTDPELEPVGD